MGGKRKQNKRLAIALIVLPAMIVGLCFLAVTGTLAFREAWSVPVKYAVKEEDFSKYGDYILIKEVHYTGTGWSIIGDENGYFPKDEIQDVILMGEEQLPGARMPENYNVFLCTAEYKGMVEHVAFEDEIPCYEITEWDQWHPVYPIVRTDRLLPQDWYPRDYMTENDVPYY